MDAECQSYSSKTKKQSIGAYTGVGRGADKKWEKKKVI
jgi:hypothetical protein